MRAIAEALFATEGTRARTAKVEALAGLKLWNSFEVFSHFSLPFQVGRVAVELSP